MSVVTDVEKWGNAHRPGFLDFFRIILGLFITYKGLDFIVHMKDLELTASGINVYFASAALAHYVVFAHVLGGPLLTFGLFTRFVSVVNLPVLIGAVIFVNAPRGFLSVGNHMELEISLAVLAGLLCSSCLVQVVIRSMPNEEERPRPKRKLRRASAQ